jgi:hypothetical protein
VSSPVPLAEFLVALRAAGFPIGVDDHLRLARLLEHDASWDRLRLRRVLRCALAKDDAQRRRFDRAFDGFFGDLWPASRAEPEPRDEPRRPGATPPSTPRRRLALRIGIPAAGLLLAALTAISIFAASRRLFADDPVPDGVIDGQAIEAVLDPQNPGAPIGGTPQPDVDEAGPAKMVFAAMDVRGERVVAAARSEFRRMALVYAVIWTLWYLAALVAALYEPRRRRPYLPGPWTFRPGFPESARRLRVSATAAEDVAAALTFRAGSGRRGALDPMETARRTAAAAGYPMLAWSEPPRAPAIAILIDGARRTRAWRPLYEAWVSALVREGVSIREYDYDGSPGTCGAARAGGNDREVRLTELADQVDSLLVVGEGDEGLDPLAGVAAPWVVDLARFPKRLWINPRPPSRWSPGAWTVAAGTPMVWGGLACVVDFVQASGDRGAEIVERHPFAPVIEVAPASDIGFARLREHLGEAFPWLACCAALGDPVPDRALWLGRTAFGRLGDQSRLRLLTLPWFVDGRWPEDLRVRLASWLRVQLPELERLVRSEYLRLLEGARPPEGSLASKRWELQVAQNEWAVGAFAAGGKLMAMRNGPVGEEAIGEMRVATAAIQDISVPSAAPAHHRVVVDASSDSTLRRMVTITTSQPSLGSRDVVLRGLALGWLAVLAAVAIAGLLAGAYLGSDPLEGQLDGVWRGEWVTESNETAGDIELLLQRIQWRLTDEDRDILGYVRLSGSTCNFEGTVSGSLNAGELFFMAGDVPSELHSFLGTLDVSTGEISSGNFDFGGGPCDGLEGSWTALRNGPPPDSPSSPPNSAADDPATSEHGVLRTPSTSGDGSDAASPPDPATLSADELRERIKEAAGSIRDLVSDADSGPPEALTATVGGTPEITVGESSDIQATKKYMSRKKGQTKACFEEQLKANPDLAGKVELSWTVIPNGSVTDVVVKSNTTGNDDLANCLVRRIKRWQFPEGDDEYEITYPFNLFSG